MAQHRSVDLVFEGKDKAIQGKNKVQDSSRSSKCKAPGHENFSSKNGAPKTSKPIPIAQRNRLINRLNLRKQSICRDEGLTPEERQREIDKINRALQKL